MADAENRKTEFNGSYECELEVYKTDIDIKRAPIRAEVYSFCKNAAMPILFRHYTHWHKNASSVHGYTGRIHDYYKIYIFIEGKINCLIGDNLVSPSCGGVVTVRKGESYDCIYYGQSEINYYEINFPPDFFKHVSEKSPFYSFFFERGSGEKNLISMSSSAVSEMFGILEKIEILVERGPRYSDYLIYSRLVQLASLISESFLNIKAEVLEQKIPAALKDAIGYISENYLVLNDIKEIAESCHISISYLCRSFKNFLSTTPIEYVNTQKISHAKYMLKCGHNVTEACFSSGFNSYNYFISTFKRYVGMTPTQFKNYN